MSFALEADEPVEGAVRRVAREQLEKALDEAKSPVIADAVHDLRKRAKKVRALLRLVRKAAPELYARENARVRDAQGLLSSFRDAAALVETFDELLAEPFGAALDDARLKGLRKALAHRRDDLHAQMHADGRLKEARERLARVREDVVRWRVPAAGPDAWVGGLRKTYKRARKRGAEAEEAPSVERLHEWRKRVKYHRYHCKLLRRRAPELIGARRSVAKALSGLLGDDHDLAVFVRVVAREELGDPTLRAVLRDVAAGERRRIQEEAFALGERLFVEAPDDFVEHIRALPLAA
ncbi:MAG TPA: CHAD domain-containing protein [Polyangiaceae bacterium LLY-WYZ-15_(1-7)]|nr:CHAD domain-containing protein [Polyangiaceae bacterium LLY-WYZ-15_(1-7)]